MGYIDIRKLTLDELVGVVNVYPWFGGARMELCQRMRKIGGDGLSESQYADAAMYVASRGRMAEMVRSSVSQDWTDADVEKLLKSFDALLAKGHTIVVVEHNTDVIRAADWVIDLGPEAGDEGAGSEDRTYRHGEQ